VVKIARNSKSRFFLKKIESNQIEYRNFRIVHHYSPYNKSAAGDMNNSVTFNVYHQQHTRAKFSNNSLMTCGNPAHISATYITPARLKLLMSTIKLCN